jgi:hypothetical protein
MFRLRLRSDAAKRTKKGHAAQTQTGVASASSTYPRARPTRPNETPAMDPMTRTSSGSDSAADSQNRRVMSRSSESSCSSVGWSGSRAMPHFGHGPGRSDRTSGCIGHV